MFFSADGPDSVSCFLFVHEMMGNREKVRTSEGCKLGKARLRTNCTHGRRGSGGGDPLLASVGAVKCLFHALLPTNKTTTPSCSAAA